MDSPKVVVVGSSYSSACSFYFLQQYLLKSRSSFDIILISQESFYPYTCLLYQLLSSNCYFNEACENFRGIGLLRPGVSYLRTRVLGIDFKKKLIKTTDGMVGYEYLILAPENDENDFELEIKSDDYFQIKTPRDILSIRNKVLLLLELAVLENDLEKRKSLLTFSIIGAGKEGIEIVCNLSDFVSTLLKERYPELKKSLLSFNLIEKKDSIGLGKDLIYNSHIFYNLKRKGINLFLNSRVTNVKKRKIEINNEGDLLSSLTIFSGKSKRSFLLSSCLLDGSVDIYYKAQNIDNVFIIGESSKCLDVSEDLAKVELQKGFYEQAKITAYNVVAKINNTPLKPAKHVKAIDFLSLGSRNSLVQVRGMCFEGFFVWVIHRLICIKYLLGWKRKILSLVSFLLNVCSLKEDEAFDLQDTRSLLTIDN